MEASGTEAARTPLLVTDAVTLDRYVREYLTNPASATRGYTESYSWKKTDFSSSVDAAITASRVILGGDVRSIGGWAVAETTGAATAAFRLHDGNSAATEAIVRVNLAAFESARDFLFGHGIECSTGRVFLEVISGSFEGVLFWR